MVPKYLNEKIALSLSVLLFLVLGLAISVIVISQKQSLVGNTQAAGCIIGNIKCSGGNLYQCNGSKSGGSSYWTYLEHCIGGRCVTSRSCAD